MQIMEDLAEINRLGEEEHREEYLFGEGPPDDETVFDDGPEPEQKTYSIVPLLQTALCVIILVLLVFFKFTDKEKYDQAVSWYQQAAEEEIQLPKAIEDRFKPAGDKGNDESASSAVNQEIKFDSSNTQKV